MKLLQLTLLALLLLTTAHAANASGLVHGWSLRFGDADEQFSGDIAVDGGGNVIITGIFRGTVDFGAGPMVSAGGNDMYIVRFDPVGNTYWSKGFGDGLNQFGRSVTTDALGNVIATGSFQGTVDFGIGGNLSAGGEDVYLLKYNSAGQHIWSQTFGAASDDTGRDVAVDASGNIIMVGDFFDTVDFGGGGLISAGGTDIFVAKYDAGGNHLWSQRFGSANNEYGTAVTVGGANNVIITGYHFGPVDFGGGLLANVGGADIYLAAFDAAGNHMWSQSFGDASAQYGDDVATDSKGNVIAAGHFDGSADFGGGALVNPELRDIYLAKFDGAGNHIWSQSFGETSVQLGLGTAVDPDDNILLTGYMFGSADFGGGLLSSVGFADVYVAKFDAGGGHVWSQSWGDQPYSQAGDGVAVDYLGNVVVVGEFAGTLDFGGGPLTSLAGTDDVFLVKLWRAAPVIHSVLDVPGDQGGVVNLTWDASGIDSPAETGITEYTLWRALPTPAYRAWVDGGATVSTQPPTGPELRSDAPYIRIEQTATATYYWFLMSTVQAFFLPGYSAPVATLFDSTSVSTEKHLFQVIAHTAVPNLFYVSDPDSGYSVDNIPPAMVINLVGEQIAGPGGLTMTWDPNSELDLDHYVIYRGTDPGFVPGAGNKIGTSTLPTIDDSGWTWDSGYYYKVAAVDEHENEGEPALLGPGFVTGITPLAMPDRNYLGQNVPNPFNPSTTITYGLREAAEVTLRIYDASGQLVRTLVEGLQPAGPHDITWYGKDDAQKPVASGVYFYRLDVGSESFSRKLVFLK